ncbi:TRAP transporter large permease [Seohaeicola zhoushanensis]
MTDIQIGLSALGVLLALLALRVPIAIALTAVSFAGMWLMIGWNVAWGALGIMPYGFAANWVLSSVPMFLLLGYICYHTELTAGLFRAARLWLSGLPGGLAISAILGSSGFAAVCGSSVACSAAMGRIAVPEMLAAKYHPQLATGTVAVAGTIGALIPPSIIMILYAVIAQVPVSALFLGGIGVGVISAIGYILVVLIRVKLNPSLAPRVDEHPSMSERMSALQDTWPIILIMVGIFGGLFSGVFTPTEAGAVGAFLATIVAAIKRSLTWKRFSLAIVETLKTTGTLIFIAVGATLFTRFLTLSGTGEYISSSIIDFGGSPAMLILSIVIVYLLIGMFLEPVGAMLLTLPIVMPVVDGAGLSLIWFGVLSRNCLRSG